MLEYSVLKIINSAVKTYREYPLPVVIVDRDFRIYWGNQLAWKLYGFLMEARTLEGLLAEFSPQQVLRTMEEEGCCTLSDIFPLSGTCMCLTPIHSKSGIEGAVAVIMGTDVQLSPHSQYQPAKTAAALSTGMQATVSEIFSIMDAASMKADILDAGWMKSSFLDISYFCYRILRTTQNVAIYGSFQSGSLDIRPETVDLFGYLREKEESYQIMASGLDIPILVDVPDEVAVVQLDLRYFEWAIVNVLHNALYYTRKGNEVRITGTRSEDRVSFSISDAGMGIPDDVLPTVFRPYLSHDPFMNQPSMGLGLTVAKAILGAHNGTINIESQEGVGTTVIMELESSGFAQKLPLAQGRDKYALADRFSSLYTGLSDIAMSPFHRG